MSLEKALANAAAVHKASVERLVRSSTETVTVEVPNTAAVPSGAPLFADMTSTPATSSKGPFQCLWHEIQASGVVTPNAVPLSVVGKYPDAKAYITFLLADVLVGTDSSGDSWLERAVHVNHRGKQHRVVAVDRAGLANVEPYLLLAVVSN